MSFFKHEKEAGAPCEHEDLYEYTIIAGKIVGSAGGEENIKSCEACTTRLTIHVKDPEKVDTESVKDSVPGVITKDDLVQYIVGPDVKFVEKAVRQLIFAEKDQEDDINDPHGFVFLARKIVESAGGRQNIISSSRYTTRIKIHVKDMSQTDTEHIKKYIAGVIVKEDYIEYVIGHAVGFIEKEVEKLLPEPEDPALASCDPHGFIFLANKIVESAGGKENILSSDSCTTRIRMYVKDFSKVNEDIVKDYIPGIIKSDDNIEYVVGHTVKIIEKEVKNLLK